MKSAIQKLYYSITEVSKIVGEEQHVLRYWEREFPQLKPQKNRAGNRVYTQRDLAMLRIIRRLLRSERYTVAGAKEYLRQHGSLEELEQEFLEDELVETGVAGEGSSSVRHSDTNGTDVESNGDGVAKNGTGASRPTASTRTEKTDDEKLTEEAKEVVGELRSIAAELRSRASA